MALVSGELQFCYPPTLSTLVKKIQIYAITSRIWFAPTSLYNPCIFFEKIFFFEHPLNVGGRLVKHPIRKTDRRTD